MWDYGFALGAEGYDWARAVDILREDTGRFLTRDERAEMARGWRAGAAERANRLATPAELGCEPEAWDGIPW